MRLNIPIIIGTTRPKRQSLHAARLLQEFAREYDELETQLVDPRDYDLSNDGNDEENKIPEYTEIVRNADGFFIVVPEYNHSFPGSLKSLLDKELTLYIHKPVAFAGVSSSMFGGVRAIESLVGPVREMGLAATFNDVHFPRVQQLFDDEGDLVPEKREIYERTIPAAYDELIWMAKTLKAGRDKPQT